MEEKTSTQVVKDRFRVSDISFNENREIVSLSILNQAGKAVYCLNEKEEEQKPDGKVAAEADKKKSAEKENAIKKELDRTGVVLNAVLERYGISSIQEMDDATYAKAMNKPQTFKI